MASKRILLYVYLWFALHLLNVSARGREIRTLNQFKTQTQVCFFRGHEKEASGNPVFMEFLAKTGVWVDKSNLALAVIETNDPVTLITTPRKWGKTLNLDMLKTIFQRNFTDPKPETSDTYRFFTSGEVYSKGVFIRKADKLPLISNNKDFMNNVFQKFPVVYLNFAQLDPSNWKISFKDMIIKAYLEHTYVSRIMHNIIKDEKASKQNQILAEGDLIDFKQYIFGYYDSVNTSLNHAITNLCIKLYTYLGKECIVLIDEFDSLQNHAIFVNSDEYDESASGIEFMRKFLETTFKDASEHKIHKAVLTGITRSAKATLLSGLNNVLQNQDLNLVKMSKFTPFYGFTPHEVKTLLCHTRNNESCDKMYKTALHWYDGYRSLDLIEGSTFNPWSIMRFNEFEKADSYWEKTGSRETIERLLNFDFFQNVLHRLLFTDEGYIISAEKIHEMDNIYLKDLHSILMTKANPLWYEYKFLQVQGKGIEDLSDTIMSFLCQSGYLTVGGKIEETKNSASEVKLAIPNFEIRDEIRKLYIHKMELKTMLTSPDYQILLKDCSTSFSNWFELDVTTENEYLAHSNNTFQILKSYLERLFDAAAIWEDLFSKELIMEPGENLHNYQHLSEASVRKTIAPMLERFRTTSESTFMEEYGTKEFGILDTQILLDDRIVVIEYECNPSLTIDQVLQQAMQHTRLIISKRREYKWIKFLAINLSKEKNESKPTLKVAQHAITWSDTNNFLLRKFNITTEVLQKGQSS